MPKPKQPLKTPTAPLKPKREMLPAHRPHITTIEQARAYAVKNPDAFNKQLDKISPDPYRGTKKLASLMIKQYPERFGKFKPEDFTGMLDSIAKVESKNKNIAQASYDPIKKKIVNGPAKGYFQMENTTAPVAAKRYNNYQSILAPLTAVPLPKINVPKSGDVRSLTKDQQASLALSNMAAKAAKAQGNLNPKDSQSSWLDWHWSGDASQRPSRVKHWNETFGYGNGGAIKPYVTSNPKDPRIQAYKDSLSLYNSGQKNYKDYLNAVKIAGVEDKDINTMSPDLVNKASIQPVKMMKIKETGSKSGKNKDGSYTSWTTYHTKNSTASTELEDSTELARRINTPVSLYKKPIQSVLLRNETVDKLKPVDVTNVSQSTPSLELSSTHPARLPEFVPYHKADNPNIPQGYYELGNGKKIEIMSNGGIINPNIQTGRAIVNRYGFGGTIGSILQSAAPIAGLIPGVGSIIGAGAGVLGNGLQQLDSKQKWDPAQSLNAGMAGGLGAFGAKGMFGAKMADGGISQGVPINVEGHNVKNTQMATAKKGELLVKGGRIAKNYISRPPHPLEGQNPEGNDEVQEGMIVIPKDRSNEYINGDRMKRKQIERSIVSQQEDRERKSNMKGDMQANKFISKLVDGGYISPGIFAEGGQIYNAETAGYPTGGEVNNPNNLMKKGGWIQGAINPSHKGWCTPLSNPHCTGHRRALAMRFKHGDLHRAKAGSGVQATYEWNVSGTKPDFSTGEGIDTQYSTSYPDYGQEIKLDPGQSIMGNTTTPAKMTPFDKYNAFQAASQILPAVGDIMDMTAKVTTPAYRPIVGLTPNLLNPRTGQSEINQSYNSGYNKLRDSGVYSRSAQRNLVADRMQTSSNQALNVANQNVGIRNQFAGMNADINKYNNEQLSQLDMLKAQGEAKRREARRNLLDRIPNAAGSFMQNKFYAKALGI